jgi:hypothetical protein
MGYTVKQVEEIASKLRALPAIEPPPKDLTKSDVVRMLAKEIKSLQKRGYSLEQIASSLKGEGLDISTPTLKSYMQKAKTAGVRAKAGSGTSGSKKAASTQSDGGSEDISSTSTTSQAEGSTDRKTARSSGTFAPRPDSVDL